MCSLVDSMLREVEKTYPDLVPYAVDVRQVAVLRLMRQLAQVYDKISISKVTLSLSLSLYLSLSDVVAF